MVILTCGLKVGSYLAGGTGQEDWTVQVCSGSFSSDGQKRQKMGWEQVGKRMKKKNIFATYRLCVVWISPC